jgi:diaminohydroxyphosphoribosylaminopyrimidine deaminase/5-amino-6-(5-phosphoribosylamino)uracil reductase
VVVDRRCELSSESRLARTARQTPVLVAAGPEAPEADQERLRQSGCEVLVCDGATAAARWDALLSELGRRRMTNVLVEGGGRLLGSLLDERLIDEVHVFLAAKLVGGAEAPSAIAGQGIAQMSQAVSLDQPQVQLLDGDVYVSGRVSRVGSGE